MVHMIILASALLTCAAGAWISRKALMNLVDPRLSRIRNGVARRGVLAVATVRMIPLAPFTLVNVVAGASHIRLHRGARDRAAFWCSASPICRSILSPTDPWSTVTKFGLQRFQSTASWRTSA
jgi:hypothetical protein